MTSVLILFICNGIHCLNAVFSDVNQNPPIKNRLQLGCMLNPEYFLSFYPKDGGEASRLHPGAAPSSVNSYDVDSSKARHPNASDCKEPRRGRNLYVTGSDSDYYNEILLLNGCLVPTTNDAIVESPIWGRGESVSSLLLPFVPAKLLRPSLSICEFLRWSPADRTLPSSTWCQKTVPLQNHSQRETNTQYGSRFFLPGCTRCGLLQYSSMPAVFVRESCVIFFAFPEICWKCFSVAPKRANHSYMNAIFLQILFH